MSAEALAPVIRLAQQGDATAFEQIYREHVGRVYAICLRIAADPARAEELTQDVFVRLWEKLGSFRGESAFTSWLHRLAVNVALGERRSEGRRTKRVLPVEDLTLYEGEGRAAASDPGAKMDLERALATLPAGARTVFVMHDVEGYGHAEIAEITGRAEGTSKALLHRARKLLREALGR
jgi:RNA polymerase sigma-70 factor (ECF subfamily)